MCWRITAFSLLLIGIFDYFSIYINIKAVQFSAPNNNLYSIYYLSGM